MFGCTVSSRNVNRVTMVTDDVRFSSTCLLPQSRSDNPDASLLRAKCSANSGDMHVFAKSTASATGTSAYSSRLRHLQYSLASFSGKTNGKVAFVHRGFRSPWWP